MNTFNNDLTRAKYRETVVGGLLCQLLGVSGYMQTEGKNSDYDYTALKNNRPFTFEQKTDYYTAFNHQKIFVEMASANRNCAAGIAVSKANYIVYDLPRMDCICLFKAEQFKNYFHANSGDYRYIANAGDGAKGFVMPLNQVTGENFCKVFWINDDEN